VAAVRAATDPTGDVSMLKRRKLYNSIRVFILAGYYLLVTFPLVVSAAQVTLQWDANNPTPDGYNLYQRVYGQAYNYSSPVNPSGITGTTFSVDNLQAGVTYFFVVRAFVGADESGDSNEVQYAVPAAVVDTDNDGYADAIDAFPNDQSEWLDTDSDGLGNNTDTDDDGDGMPDVWENLYGLNSLVNDANGDLDGDGVSNLSEYNNATDPSQVPGNTAPNQPLLAEPANGATGVDLMPALMTEAFVDADQDGHARTRYQIALDSNWDTMNSADYVFDGEFTQQLTILPIGDLILDPETTYYWRVRFYDDRNGESPWSATWHFTTTDNISAGFPDNDGDGILNEQEVASENISPELGATVDMMVVGTSDTTNPQLALMQSSSADVVAVRSTDVESIEIGSGANRPAVMTGLLSFKLRLLGSQTTATMTVYLSVPAPSNAVWYKYDIEDGWVPYTNVSFSDDRKAITIYLVDGGAGDDDGVQNGVIVDPSGLGYSSSGSLGYSSQTSSVSSSTDSSGGGCFISLPVDEVRRSDNLINLTVIFGLLGITMLAAPGIVRRK
jgi:chitinase